MRHDWVFLVTIPLTDREVERAARGEPLVFHKLDPESGQVRDAHIACMACEMSLEAGAGQPCRGEPSGYGPDGLPVWEP